jgi:hypothetical protein
VTCRREPYLSLVVTARNDDHGGNLLGRMQAFVSGWIAQSSRYQIPSELIVVEWNPPEHRPRLADALRWPRDFGPCEVRFIEVPAELHRRYSHAEALPLYQMIGKNAGIRRARGKFILATNIDILFSDELLAFLAQQRLEPGRMYRIDRHDAMGTVPVDSTIETQLEYCRTHLLRVNRREGTFRVSSDGKPVLVLGDIATTGSGIVFGDGWLPFEPGIGETFRWALSSAELIFEDIPREAASLVVDLEPGPGAGFVPLDLELTASDGKPLTRLTIAGRTQVRLHLPDPKPKGLRFRAHGATTLVNSDPRVLSLRAFRIAWDSNQSETARPAPGPSMVRTAWRSLQHAILKLANGGPVVPLMVPVSPQLRRMLQMYVRWGGVTGMIRHGIPRSLGLRSCRLPGDAALSSEVTVNQTQHAAPDFLHTNGCGDFTLMARQHWLDLRGYAEFDLFSMNLDSLFCFAAHYGGAIEEVFPEPMRIYHIEHGSGSGWTPEGQAKLFERLAAKGLSFISNDTVLKLAAGMRDLRAPMIFNHEDWGMGDLDLPERLPDVEGRPR